MLCREAMVWDFGDFEGQRRAGAQAVPGPESIGMILGAARVVLRVASDRPLGFVVARLCDVGPDGSSVRIAHGMRNLCHRDSMETPAVMVPGVVVAPVAEPAPAPETDVAPPDPEPN